MTIRALVVNCSAPHYNLGAAKLADWLTSEGWEVRLRSRRTRTKLGDANRAPGTTPSGSLPTSTYTWRRARRICRNFRCTRCKVLDGLRQGMENDPGGEVAA